MPISYFGKTDTGSVRDNNQDSFFAGNLDCNTAENVFLAVVCDGMGGAAGGSCASSLAIEVFTKELTSGMKSIVEEGLPADSCEVLLSYAARCANSAVYDSAMNDPALRGMGTTLVAMLVFRHNVYAVNIGDSRLYVIGEDGICKITRDHSYVQTLVDQGKISEEEAKDHPNKNVIMRAVGTEAEVRPDFFKILPDRKTFILCSDGLSNFVADDEIEKTVKEAATLSEAADALVEKANAAGGGDNITVIIVKA
jgi:protein phosphatase